MIHPSSYVDSGTRIGKETNIWHFCHIESGAIIGSHCNIGQNVYVGHGAEIGNNVKIQNNVSVYSKVKLEDYVFCGPSVVFTNNLWPRSRFPLNYEDHVPTLVKRDATIGANATIVCGIIIGEGAMIGAGSVVDKDVEDYTIVIGNPAKPIGKVHDFYKLKS